MENHEQIQRFRYGGVSLWEVSGHLTGSRAERFGDRIGHFFGTNRNPLLVDVRPISFLDSRGADILERYVRSHHELHIVGRPGSYDDLPQAVREAVETLRPWNGIAEALAAILTPSGTPPEGTDRRRHHRIPAQIPVELFCGSFTSVTVMEDISLGGGHLAEIPGPWAAAFDDVDAAGDIGLMGLDTDPLGREIIRRLSRGPVPAEPVHLSPESRGLGVRFRVPPSA